MKSINRLMMLALLASALGSPAYAGPITLSGGTAGTIPGSAAANDFIPRLFSGPQIGGYFGAQMLFDVPATSTVVIDFFGAEAGFINELVFSSSTVFTHSGGLNIAASLAAPLATFSTTISGIGTLPFSLFANRRAASVTNGLNPNGFGSLSRGPNLFASCNPFSPSAGAGGTSCNSVYLFLDDGGAGPDGDHDDFLVRVSVVSVPEPATFFSGLVALALCGARRRQSRQ
jgi:hypothetical protein